jgi:putative transposase
MAIKAVKARGKCFRVACQPFRINESCYRYELKLDEEIEEIATLTIKLTNNYRNRGFGLCYLYLRNLTSFKWNHKRICRVCKSWS